MKRVLSALSMTAMLSISLGAPTLAQDAELAEPLNFRWVSVSANTAEDPSDRIAMSGNGWWVDFQLEASGSFDRFIGVGSSQELVSHGTWRSDDDMGLNIVGTYGSVAAGTISMAVMLFPEGEDRIPAVLTLTSNIPAAGLSTDQPDGFFLETGSAAYAPVMLRVDDGAEGTMVALGATAINTLEIPPFLENAEAK